MRWRAIGKWRQLPPRQWREKDLDRELRSHLELEAEEQQEAGLDAKQARYAAYRAFSNTALIKEDTLEM